MGGEKDRKRINNQCCFRIVCDGCDMFDNYQKTSRNGCLHSISIYVCCLSSFMQFKNLCIQIKRRKIKEHSKRLQI